VAQTIDWPPSRRRPRRRGLLFIAIVLGILLLSGGTALSYYVDALWFQSLGVGDVFWTTLNLQAAIFSGFALITFLALYGSFLALKPPRLGELAGLPILINGQPIKLPVEPVIKLAAIGGSIVIALTTGAAMMSEWTTLALYRYGPPAAGAPVDPIFGRPITFFLFTLPAWQLLSGWLLTLSVIVTAVAVFFVAITGGTRLLGGRRDTGASAWRGLSVAFAFFLAVLAVRTWLGRFERLSARPGDQAQHMDAEGVIGVQLKVPVA